MTLSFFIVEDYYEDDWLDKFDPYVPSNKYKYPFP